MSILDTVLRAGQALDAQDSNNLQRQLLDMQIGQAESLAPINQQLQELALQREQSLQPIEIEQAKQEQMIQNAKILGSVAKSIRTLDPDARTNLFQVLDPGLLKSINVTEENLMDDNALDSFISIADEMLGSNKSETVGGTQFVQTPNGVVPAVVKVDSQGNPTVELAQLPEGTSLIKQTPDQELQQSLDEAREKAQIKIDTAGQVAAQTERGKSEEKRRQEILSGAFAAKDTLPTISKLKDILPRIETSGFDSVQKTFTDFFGTTPKDVGEFDAMTKSLVLQNLKSLGSNPTEGERDFIIKTGASLSQGSAVNQAILDNMERIALRQLAEGRFVSAGGSPEQLLNTPAPGSGGKPKLSPEEQAELEQLRGQVGL